ncbi:HK97 gp10 family phage protein [Providencia stuartii]|uniref:HK97 gp10 family phage protein n=1 Tax=Providencia stuartii TaxID=588 RepID=UPI0012B5DB19|nr:HK97 gp10 family phage protein [Providencia stuartii]MTC11905.1 HK97 gp10 family phage protein [Providencia stuartii]
MAGRVRGLDRARRNTRAFINATTKKAETAIHKAILVGAELSAVYTPIDTSTLINSQFRETKVNGTRITGRVGYSASYAVYVHDPKVKQNFKRSSAKKEFLKSAFEESEARIHEVITRGLRV